MTADPHFGFVVAAYAVAFVIVAAMILVILGDYWTLRRDLARFPGRGERSARDDEESS
jgi:heme exporter protein CcmD